MTDTCARRIVVRGQVQGVFFRDTMRRRALGAGISGWVRNRADGTVEAHIEGGHEEVQAMMRWCREGPRHAEVSDVCVSDVEPGGWDGFAIR